ncbi:MAG: ketoacyl-ACP synthase III [Rhodobacterales bacterium]|uniref:3-oxoacyl-[acyl-carrier-protein] synthase III C-terminal domain-containing protein n=1 Tax=Hyphomonas sp. TaxID=87 RepID=UPI0019CE419E|nr:ketoacyl-ACP synthase III [Rhodobacterales bacterium]
MQQSAILGTGSQAGGKQVLSTELDARLNKRAGWLEDTCGVKSRSMIASGETQESLGAIAAHSALDDAGLTPDDIDLILFAAAVGRQPIPATAALIKRELGLNKSPVPAFDINATCLSAVAAMDVADMYISTGRAARVLIVASEIASRALPWQDDPATAGLFGDGAAAIVMGQSDPSSSPLNTNRVLIETWAQGYDMCALAAGGTRYDYHEEPDAFDANSFFRMDGHALFKLTRTNLPRFIDRLLQLSGWQQKDVNIVIPHQASPLALEHMIRKCGFAREKVVATVKETGNLIAASIPATLDLARRQGRIRRGDKVLLIGTSAGVSLGGATLQA